MTLTMNHSKNTITKSLVFNPVSLEHIPNPGFCFDTYNISYSVRLSLSDIFFLFPCFCHMLSCTCVSSEVVKIPLHEQYCREGDDQLALCLFSFSLCAVHLFLFVCFMPPARSGEGHILLPLSVLTSVHHTL